MSFWVSLRHKLTQLHLEACVCVCVCVCVFLSKRPHQRLCPDRYQVAPGPPLSLFSPLVEGRLFHHCAGRLQALQSDSWPVSPSPRWAEERLRSVCRENSRPCLFSDGTSLQAKGCQHIPAQLLLNQKWDCCSVLGVFVCVCVCLTAYARVQM